VAAEALIGRSASVRPARHEGVIEIIGRDRELRGIEGFLIGAGVGPCALLVEGEAGIGKSTVFRAALELAQAKNRIVLACRPVQSEATYSFAALGDLLQPVPRETWDGIPRPQRRALEVALLQADPGTHPVDQRAVAAGVHSLVSRLASERPVLLAVDDVQWLDRASAAALGFAIRRLERERVGILATRRVTEPTRLDLERLVPREVFTREDIGPLSLGALQRLLRERFGDAFPRSTLMRIHSASGGNPLFALEIGRALVGRSEHPLNEPLPVPDDVRELVRARAVELPQVTRDLLLAAALLAQPTVGSLGRALGRRVEIDLEPAEVAGVARLEGDAVAFAHPLHAAAVVANATAAERQRMHRRLADAVDELEAQALHLALGAEGPSAAIAALLERGAGVARGKGSLHAAAELLERARRLTPASDAEARRERGIRAAELHMHAGDRARARTSIDELLAEPLSRAQRAEALRLLAELHMAQDDMPEAERVLVQALEVADDARVAARLRLELVYAASLGNDYARAAEYGRDALADLAGSDDGPLLAEALAYSAIADFFACRGVDWSKVERALELEDPERISLPGLPPAGVAAMIRMFVGRHDQAREQLERVRVQLAERGDEADLGQALYWLSWLETRCGNFAQALRIADEAVTCTSLTGTHSLRRRAIAQRAWVHAHLGERGAVHGGCAEAASPDPSEISQIDLWIAAAQTLVELSVGDPEAAWRASRELVEVIERTGIGEPVPLMFLPDALEALIALGQLERAEALLDTFERRAHELDRTWALATGRRCRGLLLAARGDLRGAGAALEQALVEHERLDMPFERARSLLVQGSLERRLRRRARARRALEAARADFDRMDCTLWAARAREELTSLGGRRPRAAAELTPSEQRVAELARDGLSNKQIAAALFVSVHTVEVHLSHVYSKLRVHSRAQLARRLV